MTNDSVLDNLIRHFKINKIKYILFMLAIISALTCVVTSLNYYQDNNQYTRLTWISWVLTMVFLFFAFFPYSFLHSKIESFKEIKFSEYYFGLAVFIGLAVLFFVTHLWNFESAPWNENGLFDDASWDIHFANSYLLGGKPFQAAVFLPGNSAAREIIFHLYLIPCFKLFGFNLMTFNISLLVLGFFTYFFTTCLIHRLFKNYTVTILSALIFNFLPLHFLHTYVGHRYAIVAPLLMASMYFLYTGFKDQSSFKITVSSIIGGLCFSSAIMGKQYFMGLFGALILLFVFNMFNKKYLKKLVTKSNFDLAVLFTGGIVLSSVPMIMYILCNWGPYFTNEGNYTKQFLETLNTQGFEGFMTYFNRMKDCLFGNTSFKWFIPDFPILPVAYYLLFVPGLLIAFFKKQYHFITLALLPSVGAFIAGFSDYRVLHSCPFWVIIMAFTLNEILKFKAKSNAKKPNMFMERTLRFITVCTLMLVGIFLTATVVIPTIQSSGLIVFYPNSTVSLIIFWIMILLLCSIEMIKVAIKSGYKIPAFFSDQTLRVMGIIMLVLMILPGLVPCMRYLDKLSKDPNSVYHFNQKVVAVCRYARDIVAGVTTPSADLKTEEFKKLQGLPEPNYDTLVCQQGGYAIAHTFLYEYDDQKILSFSNQLPYNLMNTNEIFDINKSAILNYQKNGNKDLKLVWEIDSRVNQIVSTFKKYNYLGSDQTLQGHKGANAFSFYILNIKNENIDEFKGIVSSLTLQ